MTSYLSQPTAAGEIMFLIEQHQSQQKPIVQQMVHLRNNYTFVIVEIWTSLGIKHGVLENTSVGSMIFPA